MSALPVPVPSSTSRRSQPVPPPNRASAAGRSSWVAAVRHSEVLIALSCALIVAIWLFMEWQVRLDDYGLVVFTSMDFSDAMAASIARRQTYFLGAACTTFLIVAFVATLVRRARVQIELVRSLEESTRRANAANVMKTRFLASVSHELRTPLNGILGYAELVHVTSTDAESREFGQIILASARQLHRLVDTMLDLAKIESGHLHVEHGPIEVPILLEEIKRLHEPQAESLRLQLRIDQKRGCPKEIESDRQRLIQILNHLIDNAIKFSQGGQIVVSAHGADDAIVFNVTDRGIGMTGSQLETIFTRFEAANQDFVHPAQGAGLGLPLANELVGLLGGAISIQSAVGQGTSVSVTLPVARPATISGDPLSKGFEA